MILHAREHNAQIMHNACKHNAHVTAQKYTNNDLNWLVPIIMDYYGLLS